MLKSLFLKIAVVLGIISPTIPKIDNIAPLPETPFLSEINAEFATSTPIDDISTPLAATSTATTTELGGIAEPKGETCVAYARRRSPQRVARVSGASEISVTQEIPVLHSWVLWYPSKKNPFGHVSVVEQIKDNKILISEANLYEDGKVTWRWIDLNDPKIKGFRYNSN